MKSIWKYIQKLCILSYLLSVYKDEENENKNKTVKTGELDA